MHSQGLLLALWGMAFVALWLPAAPLRTGLSAGAIVLILLLGLTEGYLTAWALLWAAALLGLARAARHPRWRIPALGLLGVLVLALGFGLLPGFVPVRFGEAMPVKPDSAPYALGFRMDKALAGFAVLALVLRAEARPDWRRIGVSTATALALALPLVFVPGLWLGYVRWVPGVPDVQWLAIWAATNLLFAAVEEALFRGVLQRSLAASLGVPAAVIGAAVLFGLAHFGGGAVYVLLATLAGVGYGLAYQMAGQRLAAAILTHFALNLVHVGFFSYPALAG
ncbi:MAG: CPBP family intramembrane metalloprotease [Gammaproteobacteria bacterium]|nr:CPBP family intramembrane metalloprotease [Gammaproteobacteria bacterium]